MTDKSDTSAIISTMGITGDGRRISNGHSRCGQFGQPPSQSHNRQKFNGNIPCKQNSGNIRPYIDYCGPCPVHPTLMYTWVDNTITPGVRKCGMHWTRSTVINIRYVIAIILFSGNIPIEFLSALRL